MERFTAEVPRTTWTTSTWTRLHGVDMNTTLQAAVHLGQDYVENWRFTKNQFLKSVKQLLQVTEKLIKDQVEINGLTTIDYKERSWRSTSLQCDKAVAITNAITYVFAGSVLCLESMRDEPNESWKNRIRWYLENQHFKHMNRIDGVPMEFDWKILPGFTMLGELQCEPEQFNDRIIFMSLKNDIVWKEEGNAKKCENNSRTVANYARIFHRGRWSFLGPGSEKKWCGTHHHKPDGEMDKTAEAWCSTLPESGHPIFLASCVFERWELRSEGHGKKFIHFNGCEENSELLLRTIISANQLSVFGAVADLCRELSEDSMASEKPEAYDHLETMEIPTRRETCCKTMSVNSNN